MGWKCGNAAKKRGSRDGTGVGLGEAADGKAAESRAQTGFAVWVSEATVCSGCR